jgi:hypothetical protein
MSKRTSPNLRLDTKTQNFLSQHSFRQRIVNFLAFSVMIAARRAA